MRRKGQAALQATRKDTMAARREGTGCKHPAITEALSRPTKEEEKCWGHYIPRLCPYDNGNGQ